MRFIHIADVHLGAQPDAGPLYSENRGRELWDTFEYVLGVCEDERTDLLLIAGDLFHRQPLLRELKEVDYLFSRLSHTKVVLIAGNHDYIRRIPIIGRSSGAAMCIRFLGMLWNMLISRNWVQLCMGSVITAGRSGSPGMTERFRPGQSR